MCNFYAVYLRNPRSRTGYINFLRSEARSSGVFYLLDPELSKLPRVFKEHGFGVKYPYFLGILYYPGDAQYFPKKFESGVILDHVYTQNMEVENYYKKLVPQAFPMEKYGTTNALYRYLSDDLKDYARYLDEGGSRGAAYLMVAKREIDEYWRRVHDRQARERKIREINEMHEFLKDEERLIKFSIAQDGFIHYRFLRDYKHIDYGRPEKYFLFFKYFWWLVSNNELPIIYLWQVNEYLDHIREIGDPLFDLKRRFLFQLAETKKFEGPVTIAFNPTNFPWLDWTI